MQIYKVLRKQTVSSAK